MTAAAYRDRFAAARAALPGAGCAGLAALRQRAIDEFAARGFPTRKDEAWKYTDLGRLAKTAFAANGMDIAPTVLPAVARLDGPAYGLVFVAGRFRPELSRLGELPDGVRLGPLAGLLDEDPEAAEAALRAMPDGSALVALNAAFMADGAVLSVPPGLALERPIHLLFIGGAGMTHSRNLVRLGAGSTATVMETHLGSGEGDSWANVVSQIVVGQGAVLHHVKAQYEGPAAYHTAIRAVAVAEGGRYDSFTLSLGGRLARDEIAVRFDGPGGECGLEGVTLGRADQHLDTTTRIDHAVPGCTSREAYRSVLDDRAHAVFQGAILVRPQAQKTDAKMLNENLLLSAEAGVDTKPELEIHADDVLCGHGATAGEIDADSLFYLRARGIGEAAAKALLVEGFVAEMIERVEPASVEAHLRALLADWLPAAATVREAA